jgi:hypothetical protein
VTLLLKTAAALGFLILLGRVIEVGHLPDFTWTDIASVSVSSCLVAVFLLLLLSVIAIAPGILFQESLDDSTAIDSHQREKKRFSRVGWIAAAIAVNKGLVFFGVFVLPPYGVVLLITVTSGILAYALSCLMGKNNGQEFFAWKHFVTGFALWLSAFVFLLLAAVLFNQKTSMDYSVLIAEIFVICLAVSIVAYRPKNKLTYLAVIIPLTILFAGPISHRTLVALGLGDSTLAWVTVDMKITPMLDAGDVEYEKISDDLALIRDVQVELKLGRDLVFSAKSAMTPNARSQTIVIPRDMIKGSALPKTSPTKTTSKP